MPGSNPTGVSPCHPSFNVLFLVCSFGDPSIDLEKVQWQRRGILLTMLIAIAKSSLKGVRNWKKIRIEIAKNFNARKKIRSLMPKMTRRCESDGDAYADNEENFSF